MNPDLVERCLGILACVMGVASWIVYFFPSVGSYGDFMRLQLAGGMLATTLFVSLLLDLNSASDRLCQWMGKRLYSRGNGKP